MSLREQLHHGARRNVDLITTQGRKLWAKLDPAHAVKLREQLATLIDAEQPLPRAEQLPKGLRGFLQRLWEGLSPEARAALGLLCAARQALPIPLLGELLGWKDDAADAFLRAARPLLLVEPAPASTSVPESCVRLDHTALRDFVEEQLGPTMLHQSHRQLAASLCTWPPLEDHLYGFRRLYALRHAVTQHIETDAVSHAEQVIGNVDYLVAKCQELGSAALAEDLEHAAARCAVREAARTFAALAQALRVAAHWLRQDPGALPGLLYNLLRCANWTPAAIERVLHYPPGRLRFRLRYPLQRRDTSVHTFAGHWDSVVACALTPDGRRLISVSLDHTLRLWDLNSGAPLMHFYGYAGSAAGFAVTPDGQSLLYAAEDHSLVLYDLGSGALLRRFRGHSSVVSSCLVAPDGQHAISAAGDNTIRVWRLHSGEQVMTLTGHQAPPSALAVTRDGRFLISSSWDHTLRIWELRSGRAVRTLNGHSGAVSGFTLTPDGKHVLSASWDHSLRLWDLNTGARQHVLVGHSGPVNGCVVTPDGRVAVSASDDQTLKVWDLNSGRELRTLAGHTAPVKGCALGPDGKTVISVSDDCTLRQWDISTGSVLRTFVGHLAAAVGCAVPRDGRQLLSVSEDRTLKLWDLSAEPESPRSAGHTDAINSLWLSPDGMQLVTASEDRSVKIWDLMLGTVLRTISGHGDAVTACTCDAECRIAITASTDRTVAAWDLQSGGEILRFSTVATASRTLSASRSRISRLASGAFSMSARLNVAAGPVAIGVAPACVAVMITTSVDWAPEKASDRLVGWPRARNTSFTRVVCCPGAETETVYGPPTLRPRISNAPVGVVTTVRVRPVRLSSTVTVASPAAAPSAVVTVPCTPDVVTCEYAAGVSEVATAMNATPPASFFRLIIVTP